MPHYIVTDSFHVPGGQMKAVGDRLADDEVAKIAADPEHADLLWRKCVPVHEHVFPREEPAPASAPAPAPLKPKSYDAA